MCYTILPEHPPLPFFCHQTRNNCSGNNQSKELEGAVCIPFLKAAPNNMYESSHLLLCKLKYNCRSHASWDKLSCSGT